MIQANNATEASKQIDPDWKVEVPTSIDQREKDYYHVIHVKRTANTVTKKFENNVNVQKYNQDVFATMNFKQLGYSDSFIFHDPMKEEGEEETKEPAKTAEPKADDDSTDLSKLKNADLTAIILDKEYATEEDLKGLKKADLIALIEENQTEGAE